MAESADKAEWNRTFSVLAQLYNSSRGEKDDAIDPLLFYPWERDTPAKAPPPTAEQDRMLSDLFPGK